MEENKKECGCLTPSGFFSVVQIKEDANQLVVRARVKEDLGALRRRYMPKLKRTISTPKRDYPYRAVINKEDFAEGLRKIALDIQYTNFKEEVGRKDPLRAHVYHSVWNELRRMTALTVKTGDKNDSISTSG